MSNIDKRALREAAERSISEEGEAWWDEELLASDYGLALHKADAKFIASVKPTTMLALLDELEDVKSTLFAAQQRIFELEARTLSVKLPDPSSKAFWGGSGKNEAFYPSTYKIWVKESIERAGAIAQVAVKVV